jgi:hypothetical protein
MISTAGLDENRSSSGSVLIVRGLPKGKDSTLYRIPAFGGLWNLSSDAH